MIKEVCILTKSYKHGGYCVAGIDLSTKKFIRLVEGENPENNEIPKYRMSVGADDIDCLDIIKVNFLKHLPCGCQTENYVINDEQFTVLGSVAQSGLSDIISLDNDEFLIKNTRPYLDEEEIGGVGRSLFLYRVKNLKIQAELRARDYEVKYKYKCEFVYKSHRYVNFSLTDPEYRHVNLNDTVIENAVIIVSLPCIPHNDGLYYKFIARIIKLEGAGGANAMVAIKPAELVLHTQQTPGTVLFQNYEDIKSLLAEKLSYYDGYSYTVEDYDTAINHKDELGRLKRELEKKKREIEKIYNEPYRPVEAQLEELIELVKKPYKVVENFINENERRAKIFEIENFTRKRANDLGIGEYAREIISSSAFFNKKWLNRSCSASKWKDEINGLLCDIAADIQKIRATAGANLNSAMAIYFEAFSIAGVEKFLNSLPAGYGEEVIATPVMSKDFAASHTESAPVEVYGDSVLQALKNRLDPFTGEIIKGMSDELFNWILGNIRADGVSAQPSAASTRQVMAGQRWTKDEEETLRGEYLSGMSIKEIAALHKRTVGGIRARLELIGLIQN